VPERQKSGFFYRAILIIRSTALLAAEVLGGLAVLLLVLSLFGAAANGLELSLFGAEGRKV